MFAAAYHMVSASECVLYVLYFISNLFALSLLREAPARILSATMCALEVCGKGSCID